MSRKNLIAPTEVTGVLRYRPGSARGVFDTQVQGVIRYKAGPKLTPVKPEPVLVRINVPSTGTNLLSPTEVPARVTPLVLRGQPGPQGERGPPGGGAASEFSSAGTLGGLRVVVNAGDGLVHADSTDEQHGLQIVGVSLNSAVAPGDSVQVQQIGSLTDPSFNFTPGQPVYVGPAGVLTQVPPSGPEQAWQTIVGHATDQNTVFLNIQDPVFLC